MDKIFLIKKTDDKDQTICTLKQINYIYLPIYLFSYLVDVSICLFPSSRGQPY